MAHYLDKDGLLRFFQGLKNVFAAKNHSHTTVNGHTVNADVPSGAKFTDTVYTHPSYTSKSSGLYKVTVDSTGHVSGTTAVAKSDITALGIPAQDTTYSSKAAASGGTDVSLVTTGEKYTWNSKTSNTGTVTSVATGVGLTGGSITTSGTIKAKLRSETALTRDSAAATETENRVYPVAQDKSGYLAVNVPWTDTNTQTITGVKGNSESSYRTGNVNLTAANIGAAAATHSHAASDISSGTLDAARLPLASGSANGAMSKSDKVKLDAFADPEFYVKTINGVAPDVNGNVVVSSDQDGHMFQFRGQYFQLNIPQTGWTQATGGSYYVEIPLSGVNADNVIHPTWYNAEVLTDTVELYIYSSTVMRVTTTTVPDGNLLVEGEISNYPESATAHPARAAQLYPHRVKASCPIEIGWSGDNTFIMLEAADGSQKQYVINDTKGIVASKRDSASDNWEVIPQDVSYGGNGMTGAAAISITAASGVTINSNESFRFGKIGVLSFRATFTATGKTSVGTIAAGSRPGKNFYGNMMNDTLGNAAVRAFAIGSAGNIACETNYTANKQYRFNLVYQIA